MKATSHAFINQLLACLVVAFGAAGSIGLGTVWMRHQISVTANANKVLELRIVELERHLAENATAIETEESGDLLRRRNVEWNLGLVPPREAVTLRVAGDPMRLLALKNNRNLFRVETGPAALRVSLGP